MKRIIISLLAALAIPFNLAAQSPLTYYSEQPNPAWSGEHSKWRIDINGGYGARLGKLPETDDEYMLNHASRLRYGFEYNGGVSYFFNDNYGLGIKAANMRTGSTDIATQIDELGNEHTGKFQEKIDITYIGAAFAERSFSANGKHSLFCEIGFGYLAYNDNLTLVQQSLLLKGASLGENFSLGYDYFITPKIAIGISAEAIFGKLNNVTLIDGNKRPQKIDFEKDQLETLSSVTANIGLRFNL